jgi:hypothetical protein
MASRWGGAVLRRTTPAVYFDIRKAGSGAGLPLTGLRAQVQYHFEYRRPFRYAKKLESGGA